MQKYYQLLQNDTVADLYIYGDVTSYPWEDRDVDAYSLTNELNALEGVDTINVYINSYGGEVAEGLAIYNALKRNSAKIKTVCDGFACSIASVIFMAGDERIMNDASLLMIHNPWTYTAGNANELRKEADDLDKIAEASYAAYLSCVNIDRESLKELLDNETWLTPVEAMEYGFATAVIAENKSNHASQSVRKALMQKLAPAKNKEPQTPKTMMEIMADYFNSKEM